MKIARPIATALRLSVIEGSIHAVYAHIITGVIINGLLLTLGATPLQFSILNGLPLLSRIFMLPAARLIQSRDIRKPFVLLMEGISRSVWLTIPLILLLPDGSQFRIWAVLAVACISHTVGAGGAVGWLSWISDLVPEQIRGIYFGARNAILGIIGITGLSIASNYIDTIRENFGEGQKYLCTIVWLIAISFGFAATSWILLNFQYVRRMRHMVTTGWSAIWETVFSSHGKHLAITWGAFAVATGIATGLYMPTMLQRFNMSFIDVTFYSWIALVTTTVASPLMGRFTDRFGYKNTLILGWIGIFWQPFLFILTPNDAPHFLGIMPITIMIDAVAGGIFWTTWGIAQTNLAIATAPSERRAGLIAGLTALAGIIGFASAMVGGTIGTVIGDGTIIHFAGMSLDNFRFPMLLSVGLRIIAGFTLFMIDEPEKKKSPVTTGQAFVTVWKILTGKPIR